MKSWIKIFGLGLVTILIGSLSARAQLAAPPDSIVQATAESQGLPLTARVDLPLTGTYWLITSNGFSLPMPCAPLDQTLPIYALSDKVFLIDGTGGLTAVNRHRAGFDTVDGVLAAQANAVENLVNQNLAMQMRPMMRAQSTDFPFPGDLGNFTNDAANYTWDTNQLWLEITNVTTATTFANLHNATNQVYAIWSATDLATPLYSWQVATEIWPTDTNCQPFTVPNSTAPNQFLRAEDWTTIDSDNDGIPDWWIWKYFGNLSETATNLDSGGIYTLGYDFTNGYDPNVIEFSVAVTNNYSASPNVPVTLEIRCGQPSYYAVLLDDTNFTASVWNNYVSPNVTVNLGLTEGWHEVWIGLRGHADTADAVWQRVSIYLELTSSTLVLTGPTNNPVSTPFIQLTGYSPVPLTSISYDLNNSAGTITNLTGYLNNQGYDSDHQVFATNYFQCYDVPVTNGLNVITLHATDVMGKTTTLTTNYTVDYTSDHTAPVLDILWPTNGTIIAGSSFMVEAHVDDPVATITATVVNGNGTSNTVTGAVDRDGAAWVKDLTLAAGTNVVTVTATDAAGNASSTNVTVYQGSVLLTINPLDMNLIGTISGTMSDPSAHIDVNGMIVSAGNGAGDWQATGVPVNAGETAVYNLKVYPGDGIWIQPNVVSHGGNELQRLVNTRNLQANDQPMDSGLPGLQLAAQRKPPVVQVVDFHCHDQDSQWFYFYADPWWWNYNYISATNTVNWRENAGGKFRTYLTYAFYQSDPPDQPYVVDVSDVTTNMPTDFEGANAVYAMSMEHYVALPTSTLLLFKGAGSVMLPIKDRKLTADAHTALKTRGQWVAGQTNLYLVKVQVRDLNDQPVPVAQVRVPGYPLTLDVTDTNWGDYYVSAPGQATVAMTPQTDAVTNFTFQFQVVPALTLESRDRLVHGTLRTLGSDIVNVTIANRPNSDSTQALGTYHDVFGNDTNHPADHQTYASEEDILSETEVAAIENGTYNFGSQQVIFVRDAADPRLLHFYTVADKYGTLNVELELQNQGSTYHAAATQPLTRDLQGDFGDVITYLDARIDSPELVSVPVPATPPIQQRSLLVKCLFQVFKGEINPPLALTRGTVEGFMGGAHSDYDGLVGVWNLLSSSAQRAAAFQALTTWRTYQQIPAAIQTGALNFMTEAEISGVTFQFDQADFTDVLSVRSYVGGYAAGFTTEQICVAAVGAGIAAKTGTAAKIVIASTDVGQKLLDGMSIAEKAVQRFKALSVDFTINAAKKAARTEELAKAAGRMADIVSKMPFKEGKSVGDIIVEYVDNLNVIAEELAAIGKPPDSFGVKAHEQLAKLLDRDLGFSPGEKAMRGNIRLFDKLVVGESDRYDDLIKLFMKADETIDKDSLKASLESFKDATDASAGNAKFYLKNPEVAHPNGYRYMDDITLIQQNGNKLPVHSGEGWYCSFDEYSQSADAVSKLQLPTGSAGKYRVEFATASVKDNVRIPYGHKQEYEWFEPLTRDYPNLGDGSGTQVLISDTEIPITAIWDVSGATPIRIY